MPFKLEITDFRDFLLFISIIRGKDLDSAEVARITKEVNKSSETLEKAVENATPQEEKNA